jgi:hypothetical protein
MVRMRLALVCVAVLLLLGSFASRIQADSATIPPGVDPQLWQQLSPKLGIALRLERRPTASREFAGTIMFRDGETWRKVILEAPPPGAVPAR